MIKTRRLTQIALAVKDAQRSFHLYREIFGLVEVYDQNEFVQAQTGSWDVIVFDENLKRTGKVELPTPIDPISPC